MTSIENTTIVKGPPTQVLFAAAMDQSQTVSEISDQVDSPKSYVSELLSELESEGLVQSKKSEDDGRKRIYEITDEGLDLVDVLLRIYTDTES